MRRARVLTAQVVGASELLEIPSVKVNNKALVGDTANYLRSLKAEHSDLFYFMHKDGRRELIPTKPEIYEDVLTNDEIYGTPGEAANVQISKTIFAMPAETMAAHLNDFANGVKRYNQENGEAVAAVIAKKMEEELATWPSEGECDLDAFGDVLFWAMIESLFGPVASKKINPNLPGEFAKIDGHLWKMLRSGKVDAQTRKDIDSVVSLFLRGVEDGTANGPLVNLYRGVMKGEPNEKQDAARMSVVAWWGGLGNTLPNTMNTFASILGTPEVKAIAVPAVLGQGEFGADGGKRYLIACFKDSLRLNMTNAANRTVKKTHEITGPSGNRYRVEKGTTVVVHFEDHHFDPLLHPNPQSFDPSRYLGKTPEADQRGTVIKGVQYGWAPFSGGSHRCSGYGLVMEEVPAALQVFIRNFDLELTEELPPFGFSLRGFGVKFPTKDVKIRFKRRR